MSLKATYTSPAETRSFEHTVAPGSDQHPIQGLPAAVTAMQADINQYLTQRMAQEGHSGPIQEDDGDQDEEDAEEEDEKEEASSPKNKQQPGADKSSAKKQKTS